MAIDFQLFIIFVIGSWLSIIEIYKSHISDSIVFNMAQVKKPKCNRKIILIKGFSNNEEELISDRKIIDLYKSFFLRNAGGAYEADEIEIFEDVSTKDLVSYFVDKTFDYVVIVLLGHGATQDGCQLFKLNKTEIITPGQIEVNSNKQLVILESCRGSQHTIRTVDLSDKVPTYKKGGKFYFPNCRQKARALYDEQVEKCNDGQVICFACSEDETAMNYYFSNYLVESAFEWHLSWKNHNTTLKITELMNSISSVVNELALKNMNKQQNPHIRGCVDFPFAVSKF